MYDYTSLYPKLTTTVMRSTEAINEITRALSLLGCTLEELTRNIDYINGVDIRPNELGITKELKRHEWQ